MRLNWPQGPLFRRGAGASAAPSTVNHLALSAGAFLLVGVALVLSIQAFGDPRSAAPRRVVDLSAGGGGGSAFHTPLSAVVMSPEQAGEAGAPAGSPTAQDLRDSAAIAAATAAADGATAETSPLPKAPYAKLTAPGPMGPLPIIAADGTSSFKAYRRPFAGDATKPKVGIVVGGLGYNKAETQAAIDDLPPEATLSFVPYADDLQGWINRARAAGHEVLIELPMEPFDLEANDTGPQTLLAAAAPKDNIAKLENLLSRAGGYVGVTNYQGGKFMGSAQATAPIVKALRDRGLAFFATGGSRRAAFGGEAMRAGLPFATADRVLDVRQDSDSIGDQLVNLEALAQQSGAALGAGFSYPVTVDRIKTWAASLQTRGFVLAPASAIVEARASSRKNPAAAR